MGNPFHSLFNLSRLLCKKRALIHRPLLSMRNPQVGIRIATAIAITWSPSHLTRKPENPWLFIISRKKQNIYWCFPKTPFLRLYQKPKTNKLFLLLPNSNSHPFTKMDTEKNLYDETGEGKCFPQRSKSIFTFLPLSNHMLLEVSRIFFELSSFSLHQIVR